MQLQNKSLLANFKLKFKKNTKIHLLKMLKSSENLIKKDYSKKHEKVNNNHMSLKEKQEKLLSILENVKINLKKEGYNEIILDTKIKLEYEKYKNKPHFILEHNKYEDLNKIVNHFKKTVNKTDTSLIKDNIFSILLEQLRPKVEINTLIPILKQYLKQQKKLGYSKIFNNQYYYNILELIKKQKIYLNHKELKQTTI
ncbi:Hypothetical protein BCO_0126300 (plasmid) [Borrelia coriaceae ATCC 43381]|uniref:Uncharacterized protein n=1 Tax=Borrelia coriaceae ATCC 43381 TaxID=1408429 RepID=W5SWZ8_9SPIR|nr:plasmid maintenance protein [Borrelia coriaceae]AHH11425.1 Hypothetical protein BCO_0126300 [Borrelia coriaceae ATCC 43381]